MIYGVGCRVPRVCSVALAGDHQGGGFSYLRSSPGPFSFSSTSASLCSKPLLQTLGLLQHTPPLPLILKCLTKQPALLKVFQRPRDWHNERREGNDQGW